MWLQIPEHPQFLFETTFSKAIFKLIPGRLHCGPCLRQVRVYPRPYLLSPFRKLRRYPNHCQNCQKLPKSPQVPLSPKTSEFSLFSIELGRLPHVRSAAKLFQQIMYQNKDSLEASIIVGGWDPYEGSQVYAIPSGGTAIARKFASGGSGSLFIYGYCDANFKENLSLEEAKKFAVNGWINIWEFMVF